MVGRLAGKRCIVTGAGSGIGRAGAMTFAREGGRVAVVDINAEAAAGVADEIAAAGGQANAFACDVGDQTAVETCVAQVAETFGGIDVCWSNAGTGDGGTVESTPLEHWEMIHRINLTGMFLVAKHVIPHMLTAGGGSLILTSSSGVLSATPGVVSNMAAKGGVLGLTRQISADYAPRQIRVNAICPGPIVTPALTGSFDKIDEARGQPKGTMLAGYTSNQPRGRLGQPEDVANVALFLASDESAWVTAQFINVSGTGH